MIKTEADPVFINCDNDPKLDSSIDVNSFAVLDDTTHKGTVEGICHVPFGGQLPAAGDFAMVQPVVVLNDNGSPMVPSDKFCPTQVAVTARCGDGIQQPNEECDGGPDCDKTCKKIPTCVPLACTPTQVKVNEKNQATFTCMASFSSPSEAAQYQDGYYIDCNGNNQFDPAVDIQGLGPNVCTVPLATPLAPKSAIKVQGKKLNGFGITFCNDVIVTATAICGDGTVQGTEECDGGADCDASCKKIVSPPPIPVTPKTTTCVPFDCSNKEAVIDAAGKASFSCQADFTDFDIADPADWVLINKVYFIDCNHNGVFDDGDVEGVKGTCVLPITPPLAGDHKQGIQMVKRNNVKQEDWFTTLPNYDFCSWLVEVTATASCSDHVTQPGEQCDDGGTPPPPPGDDLKDKGVNPDDIKYKDAKPDDTKTNDAPTQGAQPGSGQPDSGQPNQAPQPIFSGGNTTPSVSKLTVDAVDMAICPEGWSEAIVSSGPEFGKRIPLQEGTTCPTFPDELLQNGTNGLSPAIHAMVQPLNDFVQNSDDQQTLRQLNTLSIAALAENLNGKPVPVFGLAVADQAAPVARLVQQDEMPPRALLAQLLLNGQGGIDTTPDGSIFVPAFDPQLLIKKLALTWDGNQWNQAISTGGGVVSVMAPAKYSIVSAPVFTVEGGGGSSGGCSLMPTSPRLRHSVVGRVLPRRSWQEWFTRLFHSLTARFS